MSGAWTGNSPATQGAANAADAAAAADAQVAAGRGAGSDLGGESGDDNNTLGPSRRARTITIAAIVTVLVLVAGWVVVAFTGDPDAADMNVVRESTLAGYPTRGPQADVENQRELSAAAGEWREFDSDNSRLLPEGQAIELLWAGDVDSLKLGSPALRSSFSARLVILRSDNEVAALARALDGAGSGDETAFTMLGTSSIARGKYARGFTVSNGVHVFDERMRGGASLETATFSADVAPELSETPTSDGLLLLSARSLVRLPDAGVWALDLYEGFGFVHPYSGLTVLQTEDADGDWAAVTGQKRGDARFGALARGIITARDDERGYRLRVSMLADQTLPSGEPVSLVELAQLEGPGRGSGLLWAAVVTARGSDNPVVLGAGTVANPRSGAPQLPVLAARWLRDDGIDVLVVAGAKGITSFDVVASGGTTTRTGSGGVLQRADLALTWEDEGEATVVRPALVVIGKSEAGPVQPLEPVS